MEINEDILKAVESVLGKNIEIVDCEQTKSVREEEVLLINGIPVKLEGNDGAAIKKALLTGQIPSCDLLNQLLFHAGIISQAVRLETSLSVKSSTTTTEEITVARNGLILDERSLETKEDNFYTSSCSEVWEPIGKMASLKASHAVAEELQISSSPEESMEYVKRNKSSSSSIIPPMRQNSVCTNDSVSNYSSSPSSSSRPNSDLSTNITTSDMNLYDNIQSYLQNHCNHQGQERSSSKLNQSSSCDSGHHNDSISSSTVNEDDYGLRSATTQSSITSQSSFGGIKSQNSSSSIDEVDFQRCKIKNKPFYVKLKPQNYLVNY